MGAEVEAVGLEWRLEDFLARGLAVFVGEGVEKDVDRVGRDEIGSEEAVEGRRVVFGVSVILDTGVEEAERVIRFVGGDEKLEEGVLRFRGDGVGDGHVYC